MIDRCIHVEREWEAMNKRERERCVCVCIHTIYIHMYRETYLNMCLLLEAERARCKLPAVPDGSTAVSNYEVSGTCEVL